MATLPPEELLGLWRQEAISVEMAIGHITQNLVKLQAGLDSQRQLLQALLEAQRQGTPETQSVQHNTPTKSTRRKPS